MTASPTTGARLTAEALGTFVLVFCGVGAVLISDGDNLTTGLAFGLALIVMAYSLAQVSGAHFNPAVSLGATLSGRLSWRHFGLYAIVQVTGALVAGLMLWVVMQGFGDYNSIGQFGQNFFGEQGDVEFAWWAALLLETLLTAIFVGVFLAVTDARQQYAALAPLAIGLTLALMHFVSLRATGTSLNPARSIGVAVFAGTTALQQLWVFVVAPLMGAVVAGVCYPLIFGREVETPSAPPVAGPPQPTPYVVPWTPDPAFQNDPAYQQQWQQSAPMSFGTPEPTPYAYPPTPQPPGAPEAPGIDPLTSTSWDADGSTVDPDPAPWEAPQNWEDLARGAPPLSDQAFPPSPNEPYWSQQLPRQFGLPPLNEDDGRTQIRPRADDDED